MLLSRVVVGSFQENCYIVGSETTHEAILIDPGDEEDRIMAEVARLGLTVKVVANTHVHADHILAVAPIVRSTGAAYALSPEEQQFLLDRPPTSNRMITVRELPPAADLLVSNGDEIKVGDLTFTVLFTPGHTPGGVCYYEASAGAVFTGDTLFQQSIGRHDFNGGSGRQLLQSIKERLLSLPDNVVVLPGHGDHTTIGIERQYNPFLQGWEPEN